MSNRGFYIAAALFLVAAGIFYVWDRGKTPVSPTGVSTSPSPLPPAVLDLQAVDITSVAIKTNDKVLTIATANGAFTYALCPAAEPTCAAQPADPNRAAVVFTSMAGLRPSTTAFGGASRLGDFGLDKPIAEITVTAKQGKFVLQVGAKTPDGASDYLRKADGQDIYVVPATVIDAQVLAQVDKPPVPVPSPSPAASAAVPAPAPS
ncbi:MAG: hypothetical protein QOE92_1519 [Chloroflexota bacterium]|nr:hypothetical protein [Chloroflexota bacterium]